MPQPNPCAESFVLLKDLRAPLLSKLSVLAATTSSLPNWILIATFLWSQIQVFFVVSRSAAISLLDSNYNFAAQILDQIDANFFFGNIFDFPNYPRLTMILLVISFLYLLLATLGFVYILLALKNRAPFLPLVQKTLKILIDLHPYILFYPIHINMIKLLYSSRDQGQDELLRIPSKIFCGMVLTYNTFFTVTLTIWFSINTKMKHPFSSKTNLLNILDLTLKILAPFLWYKGSLSNGWSIILMIGIILYCLCRDWILFQYLAYYRIYAMKLAAIVHALLSSYVWALGFGRVFYLAHKSWSQENVTVLFWVLFGPIFMKLYSAYGSRMRVKVLLNPGHTKNTYHLLHYYEVCKSFVKFRSTGMTQRRMNLRYLGLVNSLIQSEGAKHFLKDLTQDWSIAKQKTVKKYFLKKSIDLINSYLRKSSERLWLAKLTLARFYSESETNFAQASLIIDEGVDSNIFQRNSFLYIKVKILQKLQTKPEQEDNSQSQLSVRGFIRLQETFKKIQKDLVKSVSLHVEFWKHFQLPKPNLLKLLSLAQQSKHHSKKLSYITQTAKLFAQHNFSEPLLICGLYFHFFQYKMAIAQPLIREFFQLEQKAQDNPTASRTIRQKHEFTSESIYFVVSPSQNKLGQILDCSGRVGSVLGIPKDLLVGHSINTLIPPLLAKYHDNFLRSQQQQQHSSNRSVLNKTREVMTLMKDGYIVSAHLHIALTHVQKYELCYYSLLQPIKDDTRRAIIANNGLMSSCSRNFAEDLGIIDYSNKDTLNIWEICPDFGNITPIAKRKFGSALKSLRNLKRTSLGHAHLKNALTKTSLVLSEDTHIVEEQEEEKGYFVKTISTRECQLSFFPCWYRTPQEREGVEPLVYQAYIRKFEVAGVEMAELEMKKVSSFSFVAPAILRQNNLKSLKSSYFHTARTNYMENLSPRNTARTENGPLISPQSMSSARGQFKLSPRLLDNYDTVDSPHLKKELIIIQQEELQSPELKRKRSSGLQAKGDDEDFEESESTGRNKKAAAKLKGLLNMEVALDQEKEEADLLGKILMSSTDGGTGAVFENARSVRNQKILKGILESKRRKNETIFYIFSFILTSGVLLFLLIWLNTETSSISRKVSKYSGVLQSAYFRSYWTNILTQSTLYWVGAALQWINYTAGLDVLAAGFDKSVHQMNYFNQLLETSLGDVKSEILELAYVKNVRIYDRDSNNEKQLVGYDNTFAATSRVVTRGLKNLLGQQNFMTEINKETIFIIDNALNDLQVYSEPLTAMIKDSLFAIFGDSRDKMIKVIGGVFGVVFLFIMFSVKYIMTGNAEFNRFANILFTLQASDIKEIEHFGVTFREILEKDIEARELLVNLFDLNLKKNQQHIENDRNAKQRPRKAYNDVDSKADASVKRIYARNYAFFIGLLIFTGFTIGFTSVYYSQASSKLTIMENQQRNINSALTYVNNLAWICIELQLAPLLNFTAGTRNRPINETIMEDIKGLRDVVTLQDSLKNQDGKFSSAMERILFKFGCDYAYSEYYSYDLVMFKRECLLVADGEDSVGLLELTSRIGMTLTTDVPAFLKGPKDIDTLKKFYYKAFYDYGTPNDVLFMLLLNAYAVAEDEFNDLVESLTDLQVTLAWVAVTISLIFSVVIWVFVIRKLTRMELEIKELLLLVPSRVIMKNILVKRYIVMMTAGSESAKNQALKLLR